MEIINRTLIYCSGASYTLLNSLEDKIALAKEKSKYAGLGLSVLLISILSSVSATFFITYAFSTKTPNPITGDIEFSFSNYYILAGILWGLIIFSIDRNIIVSIKKTGVLTQELIQATPRIILAIFIGIIISTPLEMKFFEKEITEKVEEIILLDEKGKMAGDIIDMKNQVNTAKNNLAKIEQDKIIADQKAIDERNGLGITGEGGYGDKTKELEAKANLLSPKVIEAQVYFDSLTKKYNSIQNNVSLDVLRKNGTIQRYDGAEKRIKALYSLSGFHWLISILFIILELTPVLVKLMTKRGIYDEMIDRIDYENEVNQKLQISNLNDNLNTILKINTEKNNLKLQAELKANEELLNSISTAQAEIAKLAVEQWKQDELEKIKNGKNNIINSNIQNGTTVI